MIGTLVTPTTTSIRRPLVLDVPCVHFACVYSACVLFVRWNKEFYKKKSLVPFATYQKPILTSSPQLYLVADVNPRRQIFLKYFPSHLSHLPLRSDSSARYKTSPILSQIAGNFGHLTDESDSGLHAPTGASASRSRRKPQLKANLVKTRGSLCKKKKITCEITRIPHQLIVSNFRLTIDSSPRQYQLIFEDHHP